MTRPRERPHSSDTRARKVTSAPGQPRIDTGRDLESGRGERRPHLGRGAISTSGLRLRVPIALKLSAMIALLVVIFMSWQTKVTIETSRHELDKQINQGGLELVAAIASLLRIDEGRRPGDDLGRALELLQSSLGAERVLNVIVYDEAGEAIATSRRESGFTRTVGQSVDFEKARAAGVTIREFDYEGVPVRSFRRALGEGPTRLSGEVEIYLSAQDIADAGARLTRALVAVSVTACLAAAVAAFLLGRLLTRPIRVLVRDLRSVSRGDLDHQSQVNSSDELGDLARAFNIMTRSLRVAEEARMAQKTLEHDLAVATRIQTRLLPDEVPEVPGIDIAAYYVSAKEVGGDYYDFIPIKPHHLGVVVADVSGKGIPAALVMTMTRSLLRMASEKEPSPAKTVLKVNRVLSADMNPGMFVTMAYLVLDLQTHEAQLVRCGHNAPYLYRSGTRKLLALESGGIAFGLDRGGTLFSAQLQIQRIAFETGDLLVLYSDGIVEGKNSRGDDYGDQRLMEVVSAHAESSARDLIEVVIEDLKSHRRGAAQSDDITLLVVKKE